MKDKKNMKRTTIFFLLPTLLYLPEICTDRFGEKLREENMPDKSS